MNKTLPLVSVMIPYYNCKTYIGETIASVENQTYPRIEIIVVDDGSAEEHRQYLQKLAADKPHIRLFSQPNRGVSAARNTAAGHARGEYFVFLDADDLIGSAYIEQSIRCFGENPDLALVYPLTECFDAQTGAFTPPPYRHYPDLLRWNTFPTPSVHKAADYRRTGGFDEQLATHEDWDYWIKLLADNDRVCRIPEVLYFYRKRNDHTSLMDGLQTQPEKLIRDWQQVYLNNQTAFLKHHLGYFHLINRINEMESKNAMESKPENQEPLTAPPPAESPRRHYSAHRPRPPVFPQTGIGQHHRPKLPALAAGHHQ
ncbi:glycosyltransferase [Neisseria leonii]|uniref:Glycosyltransferase n=1 Tax=Neisseria leonii TaxID=2995413 RepID=A0AAQ3V1K1_9NEIS